MARITPPSSSRASGAVVPSAVTPRATQVGGNITVPTSATMLELAAQAGGPGAGGLDLSVTAATGDQLLVMLNIATVTVGPQYLQVDIVTMASGSRVNYLGQSANSAANNGLWIANSTQPVGVSMIYTVQSGDVSGGSVTLRPLGLASASTVLVGRSVGSGPFIFSVANLSH